MDSRSENYPPLTARQRQHVARVYPECRDSMRNYLMAGAQVGVCKQTEVGECPPFAIYVWNQQDYWIDCCKTYDAAVKKIEDLGLRLHS